MFSRKSISKVFQFNKSFSTWKQQSRKERLGTTPTTNSNVVNNSNNNLIFMGWNGNEKFSLFQHQSRIMNNNNNDNLRKRSKLVVDFQTRLFSTEQDQSKSNEKQDSEKDDKTNTNKKDEETQQQQQDEEEEFGEGPKDFPNADKDTVYDNPEVDQRPKFSSPEPEKWVERDWNPDVPGTPNSFFYLLPLICAGLGIWQYFRWQEKLELLNLRVKRLGEEPIPVDKYIRNLLTLPKEVTLKDAINYGTTGRDPVEASFFDFPRNQWTHVRLQGSFLHDQEMLLGPRQHDGKTGYQLITPFRTAAGYTILVMRGWIPRANAYKSSRMADNSYVSGTFDGHVIVPKIREKRNFVPDNKPEKNEWYWLDVDTMSAQVSALPVLVSAENRRSNQVIVGSEMTSEPPNNHVSYIITWGSLAVFLTIAARRFSRMPPMIKPPPAAEPPPPVPPK